MALAEADDQHPIAPGRPGAEERIATLLAFLDRFLEPDDVAQVDANDLARAFRAFCLAAGHSYAGSYAAFYADLRVHANLIVLRRSQNRMWVIQRKFRPHVMAEFQTLLGQADDPDRRRHLQLDREVAVLTRDVHQDLVRIAREGMLRHLGKSIDTLAEGLDDADPRIRRANALDIVRTFIPPARPREAEEDIIDVDPIGKRSSLVEIEQLLKAKLIQERDAVDAQGSAGSVQTGSVQEGVQGSATAENDASTSIL